MAGSLRIAKDRRFWYNLELTNSTELAGLVTPILAVATGNRAIVTGIHFSGIGSGDGSSVSRAYLTAGAVQIWQSWNVPTVAGSGVVLGEIIQSVNGLHLPVFGGNTLGLTTINTAHSGGSQNARWDHISLLIEGRLETPRSAIWGMEPYEP